MTPRDNHVVSMDQAIPPVGQARDDYDILTGIARNMGCDDAFTEGRASAVLAASIFHFGTFTIAETKAFLDDCGIPVRL